MSPSTRCHPALWMWVAVAVLSALALARLIGLDRLVVWHDEVFTLVRAFGHSQEALSAAIFSNKLLSPADLLVFQQPDPALGWTETWRALVGHPEHAPLYYVLVRLATEVLAPLGISPVTAARGLSALAGIALIPAAFWLARELFGRGPAPWVAALLVASSPMALLYAQEARQYALWTLLVALSSAALLMAIRHQGRRIDWWLYTTLVILGLYTHLLFVLMLPIHGIYLALALDRPDRRRLLRSWMLGAGVSLLAFGPWIAVVLSHHDQATTYTAWMARPIGPIRNLTEWAHHLTRLFVDLDPGPPGAWSLLLVPLALALVLFLRRAPRPALLLPIGITLAYVGVVLGPDLLLDGSRSQHVRYALPAMLAIELVAAWAIAAGLSDHRHVVHAGAQMTLGLVVLLGGLSIVRILQAETWWSKQFSAPNDEVARMVNSWDHPLVVMREHGLTAGELLSLAHGLDSHVRIWGERDDSPPPLSDSDDILALLPSRQLTAQLEDQGRFRTVAGTWQWFKLERLGATSGDDEVPAPATANGGQQ